MQIIKAAPYPTGPVEYAVTVDFQFKKEITSNSGKQTRFIILKRNRKKAVGESKVKVQDIFKAVPSVALSESLGTIRRITRNSYNLEDDACGWDAAGIPKR